MEVVYNAFNNNTVIVLQFSDVLFFYRLHV
jgi:hypothetical protein